MSKFKITIAVVVFCLNTLNAQNQIDYNSIADTELQAMKKSFDSLEVEYKKLYKTYVKKNPILDTDQDQLTIIKDEMYNILSQAKNYRDYYKKNGVSITSMDENFKLPKDLSYLKSIANIKPYKDRFKKLEEVRDDLLSNYRFKKNINDYEDGKSAYVVQNKLLSKMLDTIFNQVVFSNDNLVNNASAFGFSQNEEKTSISANINLRIFENSRYSIIDYLKIGVNAEGKGANFNVYAKNSWSQATGISVGGITQIGSRALNLNSTYTENKFEIDNLGRKTSASTILRNKEEYSEDYLKQLSELRYELGESTTINLDDPAYSKFFNDYPSIKQKIKIGDYDDAFKSINDIEKKINAFLAFKDDTTKYEEYVKERFINYEKNNSPFAKTYNVFWLDYGVDIKYSTFTFNEESINATIEPNFTQDRVLNRALINMSTNVNWSYQGKKMITYLQVGTNFQSGSFLNSNLIRGTPTIETPEGTNFPIKDNDDEKTTLGSYDQIKNNLQFIDFHFYGAIFFTKRKNFGFNISYKTNTSMKVPMNTSYGDNFTVLGGPIFRTIDGTAAGATFGIDVGFENALYKNNIQDEFTARLRIGIPFNVYTKSKDKS